LSQAAAEAEAAYYKREGEEKALLADAANEAEAARSSGHAEK